MKIILASQSPRRKELLKQIGIEFTTIASSIDEIANLENGIEEYSIELAYIKAKDIFDNTDGQRIVIGSDTIVYFEGEILGKPHDKEEAFEMLKKLQDNYCQVLTGLCIISNKNSNIKVYKDIGKANIKISPMTDEEINKYIQTGEPMDKAGAFAIQGIGGKFIESIEGDYYSIVGLPINKVYKILNEIEKGSEIIE